MRLINIKAFLDREEAMRWGRRVSRRCKVLEFRDDKTTEYAILSHRWVEDTEVDYEEMVGLAKMDAEERDEIRQRPGYWKIWDACQQAKKDGYEWIWVDTCCIDKRSSAELSEAINSMYWWYENSRVCYAYLHDVPDPSFPTQSDERRYPNFNGWPEWFSRGWTLQEMIASNDVRFFNKDWHPIGDKAGLAETLEVVTRVPKHILTRGLAGNRPCVAQIMSWAANRTTTRVEDRAYSLMGLLDVNMPMLYGEGKKAFQRLQLEIIRSSNDHSIFVWGGRVESTGSVLADDPKCFERCSQTELMDYAEFTAYYKDNIPAEELSLIEDRFGTFPITNRGIHIWMLLDPDHDSDFIFNAVLPYRIRPRGPPAYVSLALWNSNYYRYPMSVGSSLRTTSTLQFRQIYLRYQDTSPSVTFEIDDSAIVDQNGFTCLDKYPPKFKGNKFTVTSSSPFCAKLYSNSQHNCRFAVALGHCLSQRWVHANSCSNLSQFLLQEFAKGLERARCMAQVPSRDDRYGRIWVNHIRLPGWIVRTSRIVWERSRIGVRIEAFRDSGINTGLNEWRTLDVQVRVLSSRICIITIIYRESMIPFVT